MLGSSGTTVARQREGESAPPCSDDVAHGRAFALHQAARAALLKQRQLLGSGSKLEARSWKLKQPSQSVSPSKTGHRLKNASSRLPPTRAFELYQSSRARAASRGGRRLCRGGSKQCFLKLLAMTNRKLQTYGSRQQWDVERGTSSRGCRLVINAPGKVDLERVSMELRMRPRGR